MLHRSSDALSKMPSVKSLNEEAVRYHNLKKINPNLNLITTSNNLSINSSVNNSLNGINSNTLKNLSQQLNNNTSTESVQYPAMQLYDSLMSKANDGRLLLLLNYLSSNHKTKLNHSISSKENKHTKTNESKSRSAEYIKQQQIQKKLAEKLKTCVNNASCNNNSASKRHKVDPITPEYALKIYGNKLTKFEQTEILNFPQVYYIGENAKKVHGIFGGPNNSGYDDKNGRYKLFQYDHVQYR